MASKRPKPVPRKPRADAQRNRARILKIAKDAFTRSIGEPKFNREPEQTEDFYFSAAS
jgi:hypothetical protein